VFAVDDLRDAVQSASSTCTNDVSTSAVPYTNNTSAVSSLASVEPPRLPRMVDLMNSDDSDSDTDSITSTDDSIVTDESEYPLHVSTALSDHYHVCVDCTALWCLLPVALADVCVRYVHTPVCLMTS
jgi:hypothetical protein